MSITAVFCTEFGDPPTIDIRELPAPVPGPDQLRVRLEAWGVSYVDFLMAQGGYQLKPKLPYLIGLEAAGTVMEIGSDAFGSRVGDRVMTRHRPGAFAEEVVLPANHAIAMPEGMDFEAAAGFRSAFATAYHGLVQAGRLAAGETALIHGAAGGMGHAAIQVAKRLGATVIATAADAEKRAALVGLADHVLDYREDLAANVKSLTEDRGVDVVFDPVGGAVLEDSMRCLNWGARLVIVGFTTGRPSTIKTNHLLIKGASAIGIRVGEFGRHNPETYEENLRVLLDWAERGEIKTHISHRFKLDQVAEAFAAIAAREVVGKVVLTR